MGSFSLHNNTARPAVFLAGGIGIDRAIPQHALLRNRGKASPFYCSVLCEPPPRRCRVHGFALEVGVCKSKVPLCSDPNAYGQQERRLEGENWTHQLGNACHTIRNCARSDLLHSWAANHGRSHTPNALRGGRR
jgi:hypothetical protein